ncbi:LAETG motif-containing sortase-dependent surface protein [Streptomyces acidiscabies]|uniref:LPXTG cell wall anchor domain-containing protein n=1 Tax=Streptomyces acidiscabies TaxID=42234 RepID=A0AAP6BBH2_9ACTN|nr:LAETG motif-containing sortase-dependent surface protein [Streptomyces acidiscabies]MBP5938146.1 LPXTG cell wall anchor domain-containing protein [Streptomyces sp. LBUM 1476]MBZ3909156.1 LPXTG cell wall anchor domain-containing protein [Streptomyces acidiscabies]MDX2961695.1 LPXTG cell wall anchor domain-containing protein [Streptomyces acidiscabies]MDX3016436.1 LPXTG cell wall anchor domain-containing protein [Streptomyces acidiscabies]MDX3788658.1 LPXTG cell wall anchor domain-containing 
MSIARSVTARRLLGTGVASLALCAASVAAASGAWATTGGGHGWNNGGQYRPGTGAGQKTEADRCQFSLDGNTFFDSVKVDDQNLKPSGDGKVHVTVLGAGGTCTVSLASYLAHGATFNTSGEQVFVDFDTVTVKKGQKDTLDLAVPNAGCFAQVDLYRGAVKFDGKKDANDGFEHGELPKGPDRLVIKDKLIAAWNGGTKDCTVAEQPPAPTPPATPPAEQPPAATPPSGGTETPPSSTLPSPSASEPSSSTPPSDGGSSESPTPSASQSTPPAAPTPNGGGGNLAETGANGNTGVIVGGAAALVAGGAAVVVATRRRRSAQS